jgi:hypothetical protein
MDDTTRNPDANANRDPITGAPGAHPVGTGVGALVGGAAAGAATGTIAGPVGTVIGAAVGAVLGGLAGKQVAESIDPTVEDEYWRENYTSRPYVREGSSYDDYAPAYGLGVTAFTRDPNRSFDELEPELGRDWQTSRSGSPLQWEQAKHATRDAWHRVSDAVERATPGDSDRDGK